jgi:drug/metabolite transporter (DMT)-like permease
VNSAAIKFKSSSRTSQGYIICLAGTVVWSTTAIFIRYLTENYDLPALVLAFWRDLFVFLAMAGFFLVASPKRLRLERRHLSFILLYGLLLAVFNALWTISVALNGAAVSTVMAYSSAAYTAVLGWWLLNEPLGWKKVLAVMFSMLGCVFVSGAYSASVWQLSPLGVVTSLLSGLAFAGYSLFGKSASQRGIYPWTTLTYTFGFAALFLLVFNLTPLGMNSIRSSNLVWLGGSILGWVVLLGLAVGPTIGGYGLYTVSLGYLPASVANLIATLEPAMTAALAYFLLGERFTPSQILGSLLIIGGVVILRLSEGRSLQPVPA